MLVDKESEYWMIESCSNDTAMIEYAGSVLMAITLLSVVVVIWLGYKQIYPMLYYLTT